MLIILSNDNVITLIQLKMWKTHMHLEQGSPLTSNSHLGPFPTDNNPIRATKSYFILQKNKTGLVFYSTIVWMFFFFLHDQSITIKRKHDFLSKYDIVYTFGQWFTLLPFKIKDTLSGIGPSQCSKCVSVMSAVI